MFLLMSMLFLSLVNTGYGLGKPRTSCKLVNGVWTCTKPKTTYKVVTPPKPKKQKIVKKAKRPQFGNSTRLSTIRFEGR